MVNWQSAKTKVQYLINGNGVDIIWLQRSVDTSSAYNSGSPTFEYGDPIINYTSGSIVGIIDHMNANEVMLDVGFYIEDYEKLFVDSDSTIAAWDQVILPDNNEKYVVTAVHTYRVSEDSLAATDVNIVITRWLTLRRLVPKALNSY